VPDFVQTFHKVAPLSANLCVVIVRTCKLLPPTKSFYIYNHLFVF